MLYGSKLLENLMKALGPRKMLILYSPTDIILQTASEGMNSRLRILELQETAGVNWGPGTEHMKQEVQQWFGHGSGALLVLLFDLPS